MEWRIVLSASLLFLSFTSLLSADWKDSDPVQLCEGFVPENDQYYPAPEDGQLTSFGLVSGITEPTFNAVLDRAEEVYAPLLKARGIQLELKRLWKNGTVNASAEQRSRNVYTVNMYGGLARHPVMNEDGLLMVVCHELGHHLGGAPTYGGWRNGWASSEGQADYYGSMKCFKELFTEQEHLDWYAEGVFESTVDEACREVYPDKVERAACVRASEAGMILALFFTDLRRSANSVDYSTPDTKSVRRTNLSHPAPQCRLDTYFQAALCPKYSDEDFDSNNPFIGACNGFEGWELGVRPGCWFNEGQYNKHLPKEERKKPWWWPFLT